MYDYDLPFPSMQVIGPDEECIELDQLQISPDTMRFWNELVLNVTKDLVDEFYPFFEKWVSEEDFIEDSLCIILDLWDAWSVHDWLQYRYFILKNKLPKKISDCLVDAYDEWLGACRQLEFSLPDWYTEDGENAWLDHIFAPQPTPEKG